MIEAITLKNKQTQKVMPMNMVDSVFLLDDKSPISWGDIEATMNTYTMSGMIGVKVSKSNLHSPRRVKITGWVKSDSFGIVSDKKKILNSFCTPLDEVYIFVGDYYLEGIFSNSVKYATTKKENNELICKFQIEIFCENPLFKTAPGDPKQVTYTSTKIYDDSETPPWFKGVTFSVINPNDSPCGFEIYLPGLHRLHNRGTGLKIKNTTTGESLNFLTTEELLYEADVYINTTLGERKISMTQSGVEVDDDVVYGFFDPTSKFIYLAPGSNTIQVSVETGALMSVTSTVQVRVPRFKMMLDNM